MKTRKETRSTRRRHRWILAGVVVSVLSLGGVAVALWTANGSGPGEARALSAVSLTVNGAAGTADLYPGFTQGDIYFTVNNPNPYAVTFTSFSVGTITTPDAGCVGADNVTVAAGAINIVVAANASNDGHSIPDVVTMIAGAPDACQGETFTIALTLTGTQS